MNLFARQWSSYRAIVEHDLMEHRAVSEATAAAIDSWLAQRPSAAPPPSLLDLGCGDLARLAALLQRLPLGAYTGLDRTAAVLPLAEQALGAVPYRCRWMEGDLLAWATGCLGAGEERPDILHAAFAIHHLNDSQKRSFLQGALSQLRPGGVFLWADVFRDPGESRQAYLERYSARIEQRWTALSAEQRQHVVEHIHQFDLPADRDEIAAAAEALGWRWQWSWQGAHRAEALAVLTPA